MIKLHTVNTAPRLNGYTVAEISSYVTDAITMNAGSLAVYKIHNPLHTIAADTTGQNGGRL